MIKRDIEVRTSGALNPVTGWEFAVFGYFNCVVHRDLKMPKTWTVTEPRSGLTICKRVKTRKEAISKAHTELYNYGSQEEVLRLVHDMLRYYEYTPTKYEQEKLAQENGRLCQDQ